MSPIRYAGGARVAPLSAPRSSSASRPANDDYTRAVAERGLDAVRERRQSSQYTPNNQADAIKWLMDTGYSRQDQTDGYDEWAQSQGFRPQGYDIAVGQGDGKYGGFDTLGMLQAAVDGRAEMSREQSRGQADQMSALAEQYLAQAEQQYGASMDGARRGMTDATGYSPEGAGARDLLHSAMPFMDEPNQGMFGAMGRAVAKVPQLGYDQGVAAHETDLNGWLAETTDPYQEALATAAQIKETPLREYGMKAAAEYGVDPMLAAGWYPEASQIQDFTDQRDLGAIDQFGMTQNEYEQMLAEMLTQDEQAQADELDAQQQQVADYIGSVTGMDASQLAQAAELDTNMLYNVVTDPAYEALNTELYSIIQQPIEGPDDEKSMREQVTEAMDRAASDPVLYRVLAAQWGGYGV